jgi:hypothetical protein
MFSRLLRLSLLPKKSNLQPGITIAYRFLAVKVKKKETVMPIANMDIDHKSVRVIFEDDGKSVWKVVDRDEAVEMAKARNLDLILGSFTSQCFGNVNVFFSQ